MLLSCCETGTLASFVETKHNATRVLLPCMIRHANRTTCLRHVTFTIDQIGYFVPVPSGETAAAAARPSSHCSRSLDHLANSWFIQ